MQTLIQLDSARLWERLERLLEETPGGALVFDADGTLWTHDVGCMVFETAYGRRLLKPEAREPLAREAEVVGLKVSASDDSNGLAQKLEEALHAGDYSLKRAAEMQVWAYVGFSEQELRLLCRQAFTEHSHHEGLHREVLELSRKASRLGARQFIVSASPRIVVEEAVRELGFVAESIAAGDPVWENGIIQPQMAHPLPYGPHKASAGRALLGDAAWVATFGDSGFDLEMMAEAKLAVGLGWKPELLSGLSDHPCGVQLVLDR